MSSSPAADHAPPADRRAKLLRHVARSDKILELGPSYNPVVRKSEGYNCFSLDHMSAEQLRDKYRAHGADLSAVEEVDFVWTHGAMESAVPVAHHGTFGACIASHVVEHFPSLTEFFRSMSVLLTDTGKLSLALPDKRYCFDYFQPLTTTADVLEAHVLGRTRHSKKTIFNALANSVLSDGQIAWSPKPPGVLAFVQPSLDEARRAFERHDDSASAPYSDYHGMYFTPSSFELVICELAHLGMIDFRVIDTAAPEGCEFFITLQRGRAQEHSQADFVERRMGLMKRILLEIREQTDYLLGITSPVRRFASGSGHADAQERNEGYVAEAPHPQFVIDLVPGWISALPNQVPVQAGAIPLFEDTRVEWALSELGGVWNNVVLELGPLEAGHTYMLHRAGAASITSIEANEQAFMRCLISKELLRLDRARFLLGDFVQWMREDRTRFDVAWASGVLYHMVEPIEFLKLVAAKADRFFLWTHYVPDEGPADGEPWAGAITGAEERHEANRSITLYRRRYGASPNPSFCGGIQKAPAWLRRSDILGLLRAFGLSDVRIGAEEPKHPNGPCFAIVAKR